MRKSCKGLCELFLLFFLIFLFHLLPSVFISFADESINSKANNENNTNSNSNHLSKEKLAPNNLFIGSVNFYRKYMSSIFGGHCSLEPSCSMYSLQAFGNDGILLGFLLTYDRLIHETDEWKFSYKTLVKDNIKFYDPVKNNEFWSKKRKDEPIRRLVFNLEHLD
jgi:hypothetical protein